VAHHTMRSHADLRASVLEVLELVSMSLTAGSLEPFISVEEGTMNVFFLPCGDTAAGALSTLCLQRRGDGSFWILLLDSEGEEEDSWSQEELLLPNEGRSQIFWRVWRLARSLAVPSSVEDGLGVLETKLREGLKLPT
jgi:hypothetical protein